RPRNPYRFDPQHLMAPLPISAHAWAVPASMATAAQVQFALHGPPLGSPSSHCSVSLCTKPSPPAARLQRFVQSSVVLEFPSSHSSAPSFTPLPQTGALHDERQSSSSLSLPSSHSSMPP